MKKTLIVNALFIACLTLTAVFGCFTPTYAQETAYVDEAKDDNGMAVSLLAGAAAAAPYLIAPATIAVHSTIGLVAGMFIPDNAQEPELNPTVQIAANDTHEQK